MVSSEEEKERLQWEGFAEKEGFKSRMKERVGDEELIIIITNKLQKGGSQEHISDDLQHTGLDIMWIEFEDEGY